MTYPNSNIKFLPHPTVHNFKDLTDMTFGRLTVKGLVEYKSASSGKRVPIWLCSCECGNLAKVARNGLASGATQSCGCLRRERTIKALTTHGFSRHPLFSIWSDMRRRCDKPQDKAYKNYGGRGIKVCARWDDFALFAEDMGERPSAKHSIERVDNELGYSPDNCVWGTKAEQVRNMRRNIMVTYNGRTQCLTDWATEMNVGVMTLKYRIKHWSLEKAFQTKTGKYVRRHPERRGGVSPASSFAKTTKQPRP